MGCCGQPRTVQIRKTRQQVRDERRPDNVGDLYCIDCGSTYRKLNLETFAHPSEKNPCRLNPNAAHQQFIQPRNNQCSRCPEKRFDGRCQAGVDADPSRSWEIYGGVRLPWSECVKKHFLAIEKICPGCGRTNVDLNGVTSCRYCEWTGPEAVPLLPPISQNKTKLPGNVITMLDNGYIRHAYVLAWSVLRLHEPNRFIVYDIGIKPGPMVNEMKAWGVEFRTVEPITTGQKGWAYYQKPACVRDSLSEADTLYIDADCIVGGDLSEAFQIMQSNPFVPNHGWYTPEPEKIKTPDSVQELIGSTERNWTGNQWPSAGIVGLSRTFTDFAKMWFDSVVKLDQNQSVAEVTPWADQSVLSTLLQCDPVDGLKYNFFCLHSTDPVESLWQAANGDATIMHLTGKGKSALTNWPAIIKWPAPC